MGFRLQIRIGQAEVLLEGEASLSIDAIKDLSTHLNGLASNPALSFAPTHAPLKRVNLNPDACQIRRDGPQRPAGAPTSRHLEALLRNVFERFPLASPTPLLLENGPTFLQKQNTLTSAVLARH